MAVLSVFSVVSSCYDGCSQHYRCSQRYRSTSQYEGRREEGGIRASLLASISIHAYAHARNTTRADAQAKSCGQALNQWYVLFYFRNTGSFFRNVRGRSNPTVI